MLNRMYKNHAPETEQIQLPVELGDGLVMRFANRDDNEALAEFNHGIHDEIPGIDGVGILTRDFMSGEHPLMDAGDFVLVEDRDAGKIVSSMCLISQTWTYGGIPFKFGRPELVATDPDYRRRGLVRRQFEVIHQLSAERGELMLGITGIPWYYRQFGYEMAMHLDGGRIAYRNDFPDKPEQSSFRMREATPADLPFIETTYALTIGRDQFALQLSSDMWRYELDGYSEGSGGRLGYQIIESAEGESVGYVRHVLWNNRGALIVTQVALTPGQGYLPLMTALLHGLWEIGEQVTAAQSSDGEMKALQFRLGPQHPLFEAWPHGFYQSMDPYAWFIRVPDLRAFLQHVRPALEQNLANSVAAGYSGDLKFHNYRHGISMRFEKGRIEEIADWQPADWYEGDAKFPDFTFLQVLCGRRRTAALHQFMADCEASNNAQVLLDALYPPFDRAPMILG